MARRVAPRILVLLLVAGAGYAFWQLKLKPPEADPNIIKGSGTIEATEILVSPRIAGRIVVLNIDDGTIVRQGDVIAKLDDAELHAQKRQAVSGVGVAESRLRETVNGSRPEQIEQARAQLAQAKATQAGYLATLIIARKNLRKVTDLKAQEDAARAKLAAAMAAQKQANEALRLVKAGTRSQQIDQARNAVEQAKVSLAKTVSDAKRIRSLYQQGAVSAQQWDDAESTRDVAGTLLEQAQAHLADLKAGARPEEIGEAEMAALQARANVEGATTALENAKEAYRDRLSARSQMEATQASYNAAGEQVKAAQAQLALLVAGSRKEDIDAARKQYEQSRHALELAQAQMDHTIISAPTDGVIETKIAELGETIAAGSPIASLADLDHVWLRVYVPESEYGKIKLGQNAVVKVDSYPGATFSGKIVEIASEAEFTPKNVQTEEERVKLVYGVKIALDNREHKLKPGMPADAAIHIK